MRAIKLALLIAGFAISSSASAQISWQPNFNMVADINNAVVLNPCAGDQCEDDDAQSQRPASKDNPRTAVAATAADLTFVPSLALRKRNFAAFDDNMRASNPAGAEQITATDLIDQAGKAIAPAGLQTNNVADAFTFWWTTAWSTSRGNIDEKTRAEMQAVRAQVVKSMLTDSAFARATAAQKQEFADDLFVRSQLLNRILKDPRASEANLASLALTARQAALAAGFDLDMMELTANGFVPVNQR